MPVLNWIGKEAVVKHHKEVPFRLLEPVAELSCSPPCEGGVAVPASFAGTDGVVLTTVSSTQVESADAKNHPVGETPPPLLRKEGSQENLIIEGDNLHALKALLPRYAGQVKCIYIDPPYNTGNEGWAYNDNVKSPEILKWLGEVVGKEGETLDRHDRWLCMMYPRLLLLKQFLREDGAIFVSIDDNEFPNLRLLMDEIFAARNFVATVLWQKIFSPKNSARHLSEDHDYVAIYAKNSEIWIPNLLSRTASADARYKNPDNDPRGDWTSSDLTARNYYSLGTYPVTSPSGRTVDGPPRGRYWTISRASFDALEADSRIWWGASGSNMPRLKRFMSDVKAGIVPQTMWFHTEVGHTQEAKKELLELVDFETSDDVFITPKPTRLIQRILQIATDKDSLILDSFAGSGTTGHAVLKQNAEDGGNRRFILVEMDPKIAKDVTAERVRRVAQGYTKANGDKVAPLGGGFQYCRLSAEPLFEAAGAIRKDVTFGQLAEFVWFMETGAGNSPQRHGDTEAEKDSALLGTYRGRAVFLLYNGILKDKSDTGGNVLNGRTLEYINALVPEGFDGEKIIYAARSRFDKTKLAKSGITFHQLPYDLATKTWF